MTFYLIYIYRDNVNSRVIKVIELIVNKSLLTIANVCAGNGINVFNFNGEFDPGSELTLAACITHASRTGITGVAIHRWF